MAKSNLEIKKDNPIIKAFKKRLNLKVKPQKIISVDIAKVKRMAGVSTKPVLFALDGGQTVTLFFRHKDDHLDLFKLHINNKNIPLSSDDITGISFTALIAEAPKPKDEDKKSDAKFRRFVAKQFNATVDRIAKQIISNQSKFEKAQAKKVAHAKAKDTASSKRKPLQNNTQKLKTLQAELEQLDNEIEKKETILEDKKQELTEILKG